jgi:bacteriorhodopsin
MAQAALMALAPRIIIPGFFIGQKVKTMTDTGKIFQTIAFTAFFVTAVTTLFQGIPWLSLIPGIAGLSYYYMLNDPENTQTYRYADWSLTTPLMLAGILLANKAPLLLIALLAVLDLEMIGLGFLGVKETDKGKKMSAFLLGCVAFVPILYYLFQQKKFSTAIYLTVVLWSLYPLVWYAEETKLVDNTVITSAYSVMDVVAKVGLVHFLHV